MIYLTSSQYASLDPSLVGPYDIALMTIKDLGTYPKDYLSTVEKKELQNAIRTVKKIVNELH